MITIAILAIGAAVIGASEWKKTKYIEEEYSSVPVPQGDDVKGNDINLIDLMKNIGNNQVVIPEDFNPDFWIDCQDKQKLRVVSDGSVVKFRLHLPNYTLSREVPKMRHYVSAMREWKTNHGYTPTREAVELQITYTVMEDGEESTQVLVVPEEISLKFSDDIDKSGSNRMYEALVIQKNPRHNEALYSIQSILPQQAKIKALEVVISHEYDGINNEIVSRILHTPITVEEVDTENIMFSSDLLSFYEIDEDNKVEEYELTYNDEE